MKRPTITRHALALGALLTMSVALRTDAAPIMFDLDSYGSGNAGGDVIVTIDGNGSGNVTIFIENKTGGFITDLFLNYEEPSDLAGATVKGFPKDSGVTEPTVRFKGLQGFGIDLAFQTGNNTSGRFGPTESVTFDLVTDKGLDAGMFNVTGKAPFGDDFFAAVHVNGRARGNCTEGVSRLGDKNGANIAGNSGVAPCEVPVVGSGPVDVSSVSVPEPHTLALMGLGMLGLVLSRRGRRA